MDDELAIDLNDDELESEVVIADTYRLTLFPRGMNNLYNDDDTIKDVLPEFRSQNENLKELEYNYYIDLAEERTIDGTTDYFAAREITLLLEVDIDASEDGEEWIRFNPEDWEEEEKIIIEKTSGSGDLKFLVNNHMADSLNVDEEGNDNRVLVNSRGLASFTIIHPVKIVEDNDKSIKIRAYLERDEAIEFELELHIFRNDDIEGNEAINSYYLENGDYRTFLEPLLEGTENEGQYTILVRQIKNATECRAVLALQELCNHVVSRDRSIAGFLFLDKDGYYGNLTKNAVRSYLTHFNRIRNNNTYPYNLENIGISSNLLLYIQAEYGQNAYEQGCVVDRRLLIGTTDSITPAEIDGLLELKEGVVDRLIEGMDDRAQVFLDCNVAWMHRCQDDRYPAGNFRNGDTPYTPGDILRLQTRNQTNFVITTDGNPPNNDNSNIDSQTLINQGTELDYTGLNPPPNNPWYQVTSDGQPGWVLRARCYIISRNDGVHPENSGLFGPADYDSGVAYSYGCKDTPERFQDRITQGVNCWLEYEHGHKPGKYSGEEATINGQVTNANWQVMAYWCGVDCNGFTQHCIKYAEYPGTNTQIVPDTILGTIRYYGINNNQARNCEPAASGYVGNDAIAPARRIPYNSGANNQFRQWLQKGDVICTDGHVGWVSEENPDIRSANRADHDFTLYNSYGVCSRGSLKNSDPVNNDIFVRKTINMPFRWWTALGNARMGRIYIWT